jgi:hypothetical protein
MLVGLWPKKKSEVPVNDLRQLAKAFDTQDDPLLQLKGLSVKQGVEGAITVSYAHGRISTGRRLALLMVAPDQS